MFLSMPMYLAVTSEEMFLSMPMYLKMTSMVMMKEMMACLVCQSKYLSFYMFRHLLRF